MAENLTSPRMYSLSYRFMDAAGREVAYCMGNTITFSAPQMSGDALLDYALSGLFKLKVLADLATPERQRRAQQLDLEHRQSAAIRRSRYVFSGKDVAAADQIAYPAYVLIEDPDQCYMVTSALQQIAYIKVNDWVLSVEDVKAYLEKADSGALPQAGFIDYERLFQAFPQIRPIPAFAEIA